MAVNAKDVPYLNPTPRTEVSEPLCLNCGEKRADHADGHCLLWPSSWRTDARTLIDVNEPTLIRERGYKDRLPPQIQVEEADPDDPMVAMLKKAIKN